MPDSYYTRLKEQLERSTGRKIVLEKSVDPEILGGVVTRIGDRVIDGSLRSKLASMRETLLST
jgi:F-type H+-transporting ATPase subunit delta